MKEIKFSFCPPGKEYAAGTTDLIEAHGKPVEINGVTVLLCTGGEAELLLNFRRLKFRQGDLLILSYEMLLIPIQVSDSFSARYVSLPLNISDDTFYKISSSFAEYWDIHFVFHTDRRQYEMLLLWFRQTEWIIEFVNEEYKAQLLSNNLYNLCMSVDSELRRLGRGIPPEQVPKDRGWALLSRFFSLLNKYYIKHRDVDFYARKLCITPDYLYKLFDRANMFSPKETIDRQVIVAIKSYLLSTDLSVKNIAMEMHFEDPSYLCRFFRRMTGMSPIAFRNSNRIKKP